MNREIKFRAWDFHKKEMSNQFELGAYPIFENDRTVPYWSKGMVNIMQYTGLKDKNGKEIYEGDICNGRYGKFVVKFLDAGFYPLCGDINAENDSSLIEVVGNIYENENSELLKQTT